MPVTPFHFGAGLLAKGAFPRHVSVLAFVVSQVVIDCETAYFMLTRQWPLHRWAHTLLVGSLVGVSAGLATWLVARSFSRHLASVWDGALADAALMPAVVGGLFGGISHSLLDAIQHTDVHPFRPLTEANPLLGVVALPVLHLALVVAAAAGAALLARGTSRSR